MANKEEDIHAELKEFCKGIPLHSLNMAVRNRMASFLDPEGFVTGDFSNDYTGLAECAGFGYQEIKRLERQRKPTLELLHEWGSKPELQPFVDVLIAHVSTIGRDDVIEECQHLIRRDVQRYKDCHQTTEPVQEPTVSSPQEPSSANQYAETTIHDVPDEEGNRTQMYYDGFVIYNPAGAADLNFVKELADKLEGPEYNLRLFIPFRDDLPGPSIYDVTADIIANRCKRAIVILSQSFLHSAAADFQLKFAQCLSPGARSKKVVPVFFGRCPMPNILKAVSYVDFTNPGLRDWNWPRLAAVLKCPLNPDPEMYMNKEELARIKLQPEGARQAKNMWALGVALTDFSSFH